MRFQTRTWLAIFITFAAVLEARAASGQGKIGGLPAGARVIEQRALDSKTHPNRALVLWMLRPAKHPREVPDETYTCPEYTRGSYYSGPTRVSLIDSRRRRVINTVVIKPDYWEAGDTFDLPFQILPGLSYRVAAAQGGKEGKPVIMWLSDYNGDGKAFEFALFDAMACMGLETTLIGYNEARDRVVQYLVELTVGEGRRRETRVSPWVDYLFSRQPDRPGYWKYEIDYRGRGGALDQYEIRYDGRTARFKGTLVSRADEN